MSTKDDLSAAASLMMKIHHALRDAEASKDQRVTEANMRVASSLIDSDAFRALPAKVQEDAFEHYARLLMRVQPIGA